MERGTAETVVRVKLDLDGEGVAKLDTGVGFLDHLLGAFAKHGLFNLELAAKLKGPTDGHHLAEDAGIALGQSIDKALGDRSGIRRFGHAIVPMDEALALVAIDLSGRGYPAIQLTFARGVLADLPAELLSHFLQALATNGRFSLHVQLLRGEDDHHKAEAAFKALGLALGQAVAIEPRARGIPSQKGIL